MTDQDLEERLRRHFGAIDPVVAPPGLASRIDRALDQVAGASARSLGLRRAVFTVLAAAAVVAIALAIRFGGLSAPVGSSPTPTAAATKSAPPTASPGVTPAPTASAGLVPTGSVPPVSAVGWSSLDIQPIQGGPVGASSVVAWSGGYVATVPGDGLSRAVAVWVSRDGRTWSPVTLTPGPAYSGLVAAVQNGVLVAISDAGGATTVWTSADGAAWVPHTSPRAGFQAVVGNGSGAVAIMGAAGQGLAFSADGASWKPVGLPGPGGAHVGSVAAFGGGFVAVGDPAAPGGSLLAWTSLDGLRWTASSVEPFPGDSFTNVAGAATGLVAESTQPGYTPGVTSFWTSGDGSSFRKSSSDPLGIWTDGAGSGSANGIFLGDGTHLLGYGNRTGASPSEYWTSLDGSSWTQLALTGDTTAALAGQVTPFLMRDGILFVGEGGTWFGTAAK